MTTHASLYVLSLSLSTRSQRHLLQKFSLFLLIINFSFSIGLIPSAYKYPVVFLTLNKNKTKPSLDLTTPSSSCLISLFCCTTELFYMVVYTLCLNSFLPIRTLSPWLHRLVKVTTDLCVTELVDMLAAFDTAVSFLRYFLRPQFPGFPHSFLLVFVLTYFRVFCGLFPSCFLLIIPNLSTMFALESNS